MKTNNRFKKTLNLLAIFITIFQISCSKPAETKEEFIQKGVIMSDTLLQSINKQLNDAQLTVDSAIKSGQFVPPPPPTPTIASPNNTPPKK